MIYEDMVKTASNEICGFEKEAAKFNRNNGWNGRGSWNGRNGWGVNSARYENTTPHNEIAIRPIDENKLLPSVKGGFIDSVSSKAQDSTKKGFIDSVSSKAQDAAKKGFHPTRKQLAVAGGVTGAAMLAGTAIGAYKYRKKKQAEKEQAEKTASELLEDLTDVISRHSVYEKNADELNMQVMEKEAADIKGAIKNFKKTKAGKTALSAFDNAWRGAAAGALTGVAAGALSDYRQPDGKVDKKKNIAHAVKNNTVMGGIGGATWGLLKGPDAILRSDYKKSAFEDLDGLYKQALNATTIVGGMTGLNALKGVGSQFIKGFAGSNGNVMNKVVDGAKNVGVKGFNKAVNKTIAGVAVGAGIDGVSNAIKANGNKDLNNPNNMYNG